MRVFINGTAAISPQKTFDATDYIREWLKPTDSHMQIMAPDYKLHFDPKLLRRMSRMLKMGSASAKLCLDQAAIESPQAVIVGTALGCLEDTEKFMAEIVVNEEGLLAPTAFIQSTHNTLSAQIAFQYQCTSHNFTYVQRGHSFENAVEDGMMQLQEGRDNILVGAVDEITPTLLKILKSIGYLNASNTGFWGEGATFFMLSKKASETTKACIEGMKTYFDTRPEDVQQNALALLDSLSVRPSEIDAFILGMDDEIGSDAHYKSLTTDNFESIPCFRFKHLCGEYFTASAFGHHLTASVIHQQKAFPGMLVSGSLPAHFKKVLFYNHFKGKYHTLSVLSQC